MIAAARNRWTAVVTLGVFFASGFAALLYQVVWQRMLALFSGADVFSVTDRQWRGIGMIPKSGWTLSPKYAQFDAELKFGVGQLQVEESAECHAGEVLQGLLKPNQCPAFGKTCTPRTPLGATMVSSEGACAAYYQFRRLEASSVAHV